MSSETRFSGKKLQTTVIKLECTIAKTKSKLYFKNDEGDIKHINLNYDDCKEYNTGDIILVYSNKKDE